jgi:hypothetical protein
LAKGQDGHAGTAQVAQDLVDLVHRLAEAKHEPALGQGPSRTGVSEDCQGAFYAGLYAHLARQAGHGFEVVGEHVRLGVEHDVHGRGVPLEVTD